MNPKGGGGVEVKITPYCLKLVRIMLELEIWNINTHKY